jgi:uncharacterized membrane protein YccF (DUF307 family)
MSFKLFGVALVLCAFFSCVRVHIALLGIIVSLSSIRIGCVAGGYVSPFFGCVSTDVMTACA